MALEQKKVTLRHKNVPIGLAIATGNNAAWLCVCEYEFPLIGRTGSIEGPTEGTSVKCDECGRRYYVVPEDKSQGRVKEVIQISD